MLVIFTSDRKLLIGVEQCQKRETVVQYRTNKGVDILPYSMCLLECFYIKEILWQGCHMGEQLLIIEGACLLFHLGLQLEHNCKMYKVTRHLYTNGEFSRWHSLAVASVEIYWLLLEGVANNWSEVTNHTTLLINKVSRENKISMIIPISCQCSGRYRRLHWFPLFRNMNVLDTRLQIFVAKLYFRYNKSLLQQRYLVC